MRLRIFLNIYFGIEQMISDFVHRILKDARFSPLGLTIGCINMVACTCVFKVKIIKQHF